MSAEHHLRPADTGEEGIYARSPLTAREEATQLLPGSRFLSTMEFKRIYLGGGTVGDASTAATARPSSSSPPGTFAKRVHLSSLLTNSAPWGTHAGPSPHAIRAPCKPATDTAARFHSKGDTRGTARQLRYLYGGACGRIHVPAASETHTPSPRRTTAPRPSADEYSPYAAKTLTSEAPQVVAPAILYSAHKPLPHQLRSRVHSARRATSPSMKTKLGAEPLPRSQLRTEDAWLALTRELMNKKMEVQNLQQQLQRTHVLLRSLHGITDSIVDEGDEAADADAIAAVDTSAAVATSGKLTGGSGPEMGPSSELPRPREYWQRRAYFLMKQNEELQAESDRLRRDSRGRKVRDLLQELKSVRGELSRYRRQAGVAAASSPSAKELASEPGGPEADLGIPPHDDGKLASSPLAPRLTHRGSETSSFLEPAVDDAFLRQKDDTICGLQERLRLLTQQYEQTDARLIETTRQLEDMTHRHCAMQVEWKALMELPQELARTQQQLAVARARLLDCDREVAAFHQVFDTQSSPATLRAIIDERDHLVELLQQSRENEAALREEAQAAQQQAVRAMEKKYQEQCAEQRAMARDREAQQEETIQKLRKQVATLEHVLEVQRGAYEGQLAEYAEEREAELTKRLLESLRRPENGMESIALSAPRSLGTAASVRPTLPDGQPPTTDVSRLSACEASLMSTPARASSSLRCPSAEHAQADPMLRTASFLESVTSPCSAGGAANATVAQGDDAFPADRVAGKSTLSFMPDTTDSNSSYDSLTGDSQDDVTSLSSASARQSRRIIGGSTSSSTRTRGGERVRYVTVRKELADDCAAAATDEARVTAAFSSSTDDYSDGEGSYGDDETVEKASGPDSGSSVVSSADSSTQLTSGAEGVAKQQQIATNTANTAPAKVHSYVIDLPAPPIAVVSPVSILINRTTMTGPLFSSSVRAVVHSPDISSQRTASAADLTHTQQTLPDISEATSSGSFSASSSTSSALNSPHSGDDDGPSPRADSNRSEPHGGPLQPMEKGSVAKFNSSSIAGSAALAEAATRRMPPLPDPNVAAPLPMFLAGRQPPELEEAVATASFKAAPRANERRSSLSLVSSPGANALTTVHPRGGVPIPSPVAVTPAVASNLYPQRRSSSFMVTGVYNDDDFGGVGAGMSRGGVSSRMLSNDHSTTVDLTNQYSGNASFDFVGALAERHRLEDMQNAFLSFRLSSTANATIGGDVGGEMSAFPMEGSGNINSGRFAVMGTGAVGLRKTPSPFGSDALEVSEPVLSTSHHKGDEKATGSTAAIANASRQGEDRASGDGGSAGSMEVPYPDDDEDMTSISAYRVTAGTREREEAPLADALSYTGPTGGSALSKVPSEDASAAKNPVPETTMQSILAVDAARDASASPMAIASSLGSCGNLVPSAKTPPPEEQAILSFGF